jgi:hypothetical protein
MYGKTVGAECGTEHRSAQTISAHSKYYNYHPQLCSVSQDREVVGDAIELQYVVFAMADNSMTSHHSSLEPGHTDFTDSDGS